MEDIFMATFITALGAILTIFAATIKGFKDTGSLQKDHQSILKKQEEHAQSIIGHLSEGFTYLKDAMPTFTVKLTELFHSVEQISSELKEQRQQKDRQLGSLNFRQETIQESLENLNRLNDEMQRVHLENEELRAQNYDLIQKKRNLEQKIVELKEENRQLNYQLRRGKNRSRDLGNEL
ncbi:hypothetical protein OSF83_002700 [Enterococcus hirae]|nr:hypothetical protein [Enterococcus hirae]EMF0075760.1 hypothetical protein [Enterococcus hirae]EMF0083654.1 hypothetical protein [Enterococcus hirae]EMF0094397.1 hypothetical protein [Enterococcus hirae]EMF0099095.1 hypothetical protein [Enterococcus hirae]